MGASQDGSEGLDVNEQPVALQVLALNDAQTLRVVMASPWDGLMFDTRRETVLRYLGVGRTFKQMAIQEGKK